ncbi:MAG: ABC-type transport auxiliary lipoprotein family protein [Ramlibacter sp.]
MSARLATGLAGIVMFALVGCATPDKPVRAKLYDFGPGVSSAVSAAPAPSEARPALVLAEIESSSALDSSVLLYRLGYDDVHQLRPYANARWSAPPPQLIRQRLREQLARDGPVLDLGESSGLARNAGAMPRVLRIEVEEFSHYFETPAQSWGVVRVRATLLDNTPAGERLLGQRSIVVRTPAPTPDAPGGVRALAAATDAAAEQIAQWLSQQR